MRCDAIYDDMMIEELDKSGDTTDTDTEWEIASKNVEKAKKDYEFLKKMLWDY